MHFLPWQPVTYGFLHGSFGHLFFNMFAVFMFGSQIEMLFGQRYYLTYFLVCIFTAAIAQLIVSAILGSPYPTIGASGGVFGLLLAFAWYFPNQRIMLIFLPIPIKAWIFVTLYGLAELYFGITNTASGIAHFAHLGGMVGGYIMIHRRGGRRRRTRSDPPHRAGGRAGGPVSSRAGPVGRQHVLQVDGRKRRLSDDEDQFSTLLEGDVRGPVDEGVAEPRGHGRQGGHGAWARRGRIDQRARGRGGGGHRHQGPGSPRHQGPPQEQAAPDQGSQHQGVHANLGQC